MLVRSVSRLLEIGHLRESPEVARLTEIVEVTSLVVSESIRISEICVVSGSLGIGVLAVVD